MILEIKARLQEDPEFLAISDECLPGENAIKEWMVIGCLWKKSADNSVLSSISEQPARIIKNLRNKGYIFKKEGLFYTTNKGQSREIVGWELPSHMRLSSYIKINREAIIYYLKDKRDPYSGSRVNLQIDHRTPVEACMKLGIEPAIFTPDFLLPLFGRDPSLYFQVISSTTNSIKREACSKCLRGEDIFIPSYIKNITNVVFKTRWDENCELNKSCKGCFWYGLDCL